MRMSFCSACLYKAFCFVRVVTEKVQWEETLHKRKDQQYGKWNKFQLGWNGETGCAAIVKVDLKKHGMVEKKKQKTKQEEQPAHKALWQKI